MSAAAAATTTWIPPSVLISPPRKRNRKFRDCILLFPRLFFAFSITSLATAAKPVRFLFASCNSQHYENILWPLILERNATAFIWAGDAIYADDFAAEHSTFFSSFPLHGTPGIIKELYHNLTNLDSSGYKQLLQHDNGNITILGAWDDHDYGCNNGDTTYQHKKASAMAYMHFLKTQRNNDVMDWSIMSERAASGKGVYGVKVFDFSQTEQPFLLSDAEAGIEPSMTKLIHPLSNRSVAIFLLDVRSNKTPWPREKSWKRRFQPHYHADFLGEEQWTWLETSLRRSTATVNIIVQGLQVHADRFWDGNIVEDWSRFPAAQHRLYQVILKSNVKSPILVSGDVHMAELLRKDCRQRQDGNFDNDIRSTRLLLEVTTSGMTHSWGSFICGRPNSSASCRSPYMAKSLTAGMHLAHVNNAWTDVVDLGYNNDNDGGDAYLYEPGTKRRYQYALQRNFGELEMDWDKRQVIVRIFGEKDGAGPILSTAWEFDLLSGRTPAHETGKVHASDYERLYQRLYTENPSAVQPDDWICVNYRGHPSVWLKLFGVVSPVLLAGFIMSLPLLIPAVLIYYYYYVVFQRRKQQKLKQS